MRSLSPLGRAERVGGLVVYDRFEAESRSALSLTFVLFVVIVQYSQAVQRDIVENRVRIGDIPVRRGAKGSLSLEPRYTASSLAG